MRSFDVQLQSAIAGERCGRHVAALLKAPGAALAVAVEGTAEVGRLVVLQAGAPANVLFSGGYLRPVVLAEPHAQRGANGFTGWRDFIQAQVDRWSPATLFEEPDASRELSAFAVLHDNDDRGTMSQILGTSFDLPLAFMLASLRLGLPVDPMVIATGELDPNGNVQRVDGIKGKISEVFIRCQSGTRVLVPRDNLDEAAATLAALMADPELSHKEIQVVPVDTLADALRALWLPALPAGSTLEELAKGLIHKVIDARQQAWCSLERSQLQIFAKADPPSRKGWSSLCRSFSVIRDIAKDRLLTAGTEEEVEDAAGRLLEARLALVFAERYQRRLEPREYIATQPHPLADDLDTALLVSVLKGLPPDPAWGLLAHLMQEVTDHGFQSIAWVEQLRAEMGAAPIGEERQLSDGELRAEGAWARLLARRGEFERATQHAHRCLRGWYDREKFEFISYALSHLYDLSYRYESYISFEELDELRAYLPQHVGPFIFVELQRAFAIHWEGRDEEQHPELGAVIDQELSGRGRYVIWAKLLGVIPGAESLEIRDQCMLSWRSLLDSWRAKDRVAIRLALAELETHAWKKVWWRDQSVSDDEIITFAERVLRSFDGYPRSIRVGGPKS